MSPTHRLDFLSTGVRPAVAAALEFLAGSRVAVAIVASSPTGEELPVIVFVNDAFVALTGDRAEDVMGASATTLANGDAMARLFKRHGPRTATVVRTRPDGSACQLMLSVAPLREGPEHWVIVHREVA